jgi:uncharacterized repeat protein (TIGR02543 family)
MKETPTHYASLRSKGITARTDKQTGNTPPSQKPGQDILQGRDNFAFINSSLDFFSGSGKRTYKITGDYYDYLLSAPQLDRLVYGKGRFSTWRQYLIDAMNSPWRGSCFGMSSVISLTKAGRLTPGFFQPGANKLYDFKFPKDSVTVTNLINYYQLMQATPITNRTLGGSFAPSKNRETIVEAVKKSAYPVLISFDVFLDSDKHYFMGGHTVVGYDIKEVGSNYEIKIWDPNFGMAQSDTLFIGKDFGSDTFGGDTEYPYVTLRTAQKVEDGNYDYRNIQDYLSGKSTGGLSAFSEPDSVQAMAASESATLMTNYADFTITSSDGTSAVVENGKKTGGDLNIGDGVARNEIDSDLWLHFDVPAPGNGTVYTVSPAGINDDYDAYRTSLFCNKENGYYANIESGADGDFVFGSDGSVSAPQLPGTARATIALTMDDDAGDMYTTSVTGAGGADIGLSPAAGGSGGAVASFSGEAQIKVSGVYNSVEFNNVPANSGGVTVTETADEVLLTADGAEIAKQRKGHSIAFHTLGGTPIEALVNIPDGTAATAPKAPEKTGYVFAGWYLDAGYSKAFDFTSRVTANLTLYAKWGNSTTTDTKDEDPPITDTENDDPPAGDGNDAKGSTPSDNGSDAASPNPPASDIQDNTVAPKLSKDAALKTLKISKGKLSPKFKRTKNSYTLKLKKSQSSVRVRATKNAPKATIRVKVGSGKYKTVKSVNQIIKVGKGKSKTLYLKVTAEDGKTVKTYKIKIKRAKK